MRTNTVRKSQRAGRLDTPSNVLDLRSRAAPLHDSGLCVHVVEVSAREDLEAGRDLLAGKFLDGRDAATLRDLNLELALAEAKRHRFGDEFSHVCLGDHVLPRDSEINVALADEARDVGRGKEHPAAMRIAVSTGCALLPKFACAQGHVVVPHEADVQPVRAGELDVGT